MSGKKFVLKNWVCGLICLLLASGCEPVMDGPTRFLFINQQLIGLNADGGTIIIPFSFDKAPVVIITNQMDKIIVNGNFYRTYFYDPEKWSFIESDIVNLLPGLMGEKSKYALATENMQKSECTILSDAETFVSEWMQVNINGNNVEIVVEPNISEEQRKKAIVFHGMNHEFNNVLLVIQDPVD